MRKRNDTLRVVGDITKENWPKSLHFVQYVEAVLAVVESNGFVTQERDKGNIDVPLYGVAYNNKKYGTIGIPRGESRGVIYIIDDVNEDGDFSVELKVTVCAFVKSKRKVIEFLE